MSHFWVGKSFPSQKVVYDQQILSFGNWDCFFSLSFVSVLEVSNFAGLKFETDFGLNED